MPTVVIDGLKVEYTDAGSGLPLVFVPGLFGSKEWFRYQVLGLSDRYRIICCNLRQARGRDEYSLDLLALDLARFLNRLKIPAAVLVGYELGAAVALKFAAVYPEHTLAVAAVSAVTSFAGVEEEDILSRLSPGNIEQESFFRRLWKRIIGTEPARIDDSDPLSYLAQTGGVVDRATLNARLRLMREVDIKPVLSDIESPALVIAGGLDWSRILAGSQIIDQEIPSSTLEVLEDADHFCFFTRHDVFNAVLDEFVTHKVPRP